MAKVLKKKAVQKVAKKAAAKAAPKGTAKAVAKKVTKKVLKKKPHLVSRDLERTKMACEKFKDFPVTILNFLEGTRFTTEKKIKQNSPYTNLLKPKVGGFAYALAAMDGKISHQ